MLVDLGWSYAGEGGALSKRDFWLSGIEGIGLCSCS